MKTIDQLVTYKREAIDGRDLSRLIQFIPENRISDLDIVLQPEFVGKHVAKELTREAILECLKDDLAFAFEKALSKREISAVCTLLFVCGIGF